MTTDRDLEDFLRQVRLGTTAELDERILGDALAAIDPSAASPLRRLARSLRRHWRLSMAAACVLVFLAVLPLALPRTEVAGSGGADEVAVVTESPEHPAPPILGTESGHTPHSGLGLPGRPKTDAAGTREVLHKRRTTSNARGASRQTKSPAAATATIDKGSTFGTQAPVLQREAAALPAKLKTRGSQSGLPGVSDSGEAAWGPAVDGVQARLRAKQRKWKQGAVVRLWAEVRNQGKRNLSVTTRPNGCELEVDGRWYRRPIHLGLVPPPSLLPPGGRHDNIAISLDRSWLLAASRKARAPWKAGPGQLGQLAAGKHTVRVAFTVVAARNALGKAVRVVSNPVDIEVVAKSEDKVVATPEGKAGATGGKADGRTTPVRSTGESTKAGRELLRKLRSIDAAYVRSFTASGKRGGGPTKKKWKFAMYRGRIALEEDAIEIFKEKVANLKQLGRPGPRDAVPMLALRSTFFVGPTAQAKYDWVGKVPCYGRQAPLPGNSPGPATAGALDVADPDAPTYMLPIKRTLWCLGRGYSKHITMIRDVKKQEDGRLVVAADGLDMAFRPGAGWELVIDPNAEYMVRSAALVDNRDRRFSFTNSGLVRRGKHCVPTKGQSKGSFIGASFEFLSASFDADVEFVKRAKATMQPPYLIHTDVTDQRRTPERYMSYEAGKMSPKGGKPGFELEWEKEAVFDLREKVAPSSEPKLRDVIGRTVTPPSARKGEIKIHGRQYTALLVPVATITGSFDKPDTILLLISPKNPRRYIQSYERHLGSVRTVEGKYYKLSATPAGDKLTVTPCGDNVGLLQVSAGGRDIKTPEVSGGILTSKQGVVPLGNFYYPVPADDLAQRRIPVGDYAASNLTIRFGKVLVGVQPNGPPVFDLKTRKDKPVVLNFAAKGEIVLRSPKPSQTFKRGSRVTLDAVIIDPKLNLQVSVWDTTKKGEMRTYTYGLGKKATAMSSSLPINPTFVITNSAGKEVATGKLPFC